MWRMEDPRPQTQPQQTTFKRFGFSGLCFLVALVTFSVNRGCSSVNAAPSWIEGAAWFCLVAALLVAGIWLWNKTADRHVVLRILLSVAAVCVVALLGYKPIREQYRREHPTVAKMPAPPEPHTDAAARVLPMVPKPDPKRSDKEKIAASSKAGGVAAETEHTLASGRGTVVGPVTVEPGGVASFGQQGGITAGRIEINPLPPERTWEVSVVKCDAWVERLNALGSADVSIGAFIANNDGNRVVRILTACLQRSTWKAQMAVLPANPDGVEIGASESSPKLDAIDWGLQELGLRVTKRDIRPAYGTEIGIVVGTNPIRQPQP